MGGKLQALLAAGAVTAAATLPASGAAADVGRRANLDMAFTSTSAAAASGLTLHILYKDERDPNAKPQPLRDLILDAPAGTRFDGGALPRCDASDQDLQARGRAACPSASEVGRGTLSVDTGFGPPTDPVPTDTTLYNGGDQIIEVVTRQGGDQPLGFDRLHFEGSRLHAHPPALPGGPPDGQTSIREVSARIEPHGGFITTPPTCPPAGRWDESGTFGFLDGVRGPSPPGHRALPRAPPARRAGAGGYVRFRCEWRRGGCRRGGGCACGSA